MTLLIEKEIYTEFLLLLQDLDKFMNSHYFTQFSKNGLKKEIEMWDSIVLSTDVILKKVEQGNTPTDDIIIYNNIVYDFYNRVLFVYTLENTKNLLSQYMLKKINV